MPADGRLFLVQFRTIGLPEWRDALSEAGAEVLSFFPFNAHVVRMSPALADSLSALDIVERVEPYHLAFRLEPELRGWLGDQGGRTDRPRCASASCVRVGTGRQGAHPPPTTSTWPPGSAS
jgi:hypothetical protein